MKKLYFLMSFLLVALIGTAAEVTDVLTSADLTATSTTYKDFTGVTKLSGAVYAGNTSLNNGISLRSKSNSGIVTTTSGGTAVSVTFTWHNTTMNGRTLEIYGSTTPYTQSPDLYNATAKGTLITSAVYNSANPTVTVPLTGDYPYIGIKSKSGAQYLTEIKITWSQGAATEVAAPVFTPAAGTYYDAQQVTIESATPGAVITYTLNAEPEQTYSTPIALSQPGTYTIKAKATDPSGALKPSAEATAQYIIKAPVEVTSIADFIAKGSASTDANEHYKFTCPLIVTFQNNTNLFVRDAAGDGLLIYGTAPTYANGTEIPAGVVGTFKNFNGTPELENAQFPSTTGTAVAEPVEMTIDALKTSDVSKYIIIKNAVINATTSTLEVGAASIAYKESFGVTAPTDLNFTYDVVAIVAIYNNAVQLKPVSFTKASAACAAPTFSLAEGTYYEAQTVTISTTTAGASISYSVSKNDIEFIPLTTVAAPAIVELPLDATNVKYTITAKTIKAGNPESPDATATYHLNPNKPTARMFTMIKDASELMTGDKVILVGEYTDATAGTTTAYALSTITGGEGTIQNVKVVEGNDAAAGAYRGVIVPGENSNVMVFDITEDMGSFTFQCETSRTFLSLPKSSTSIQLADAATTDNQKWNVTNQTTNTAVVGMNIANKAFPARSIIYRNNASNIHCFKAYANSNINDTEYIAPNIFKYNAELSGVESNIATTKATIITIAGGVVVTVSEPAMANIYTISGQMVANQAVAETATISLPNGFYIVKVGNNVKKVIVR